MFARAARGELTRRAGGRRGRARRSSRLRQVAGRRAWSAADAWRSLRSRKPGQGVRRRARSAVARSTAGSAPSTASTWPPRRASTSSCSARRAAARPRCCAPSPGWSSRPPATCSSTATSSPACRRGPARSPWCSRATRSTRTRPCCGNIVFPLRAARMEREERDRKAPLGGRPARHRPPARPQAAPALRRRAAAGRAGPGAGARAARVPARRAAVQPGRQAAGQRPRRAQAVPAGDRHHHHLRHPRPGRGDGPGRPDRGARPTAGPPGRPAGRGVRRPGRHLRRHVHRLAADEPGARATARWSASGPSTCCRPTVVRRPTRSRCALAVDRIEYLSGDRHVYGTATGHRRADPGHRPAARHRRRPIAAGDEHEFAVDQDRLRSSTRRPATTVAVRSTAATTGAGATDRHGPAPQRFADREGALAWVFLMPSVALHPRAGRRAVRARHRVRALRRDHRRPVASTGSGCATSSAVFDDPVFWRSLRQHAHVHRRSRWCSSWCSARSLANILVADFRGKWVVRFLVLLPWTTPVALSARRLAVAARLDLLPDRLGAAPARLLGSPARVGTESNMYWLGEPDLAMASVIAVHVWRLTPLAAVIMMAGLVAIPRDIDEAARVDGAGYWRRMFEVTIPMTLPVDRGGRAVRRDLHLHRHGGRRRAHQRRPEQRDPGADQLGVLPRHRRRRRRAGRRDRAVPVPAAAGRGDRSSCGRCGGWRCA